MIPEIITIIQLSILELLAFAGPVLMIGLLLGYMESLSNFYLQQTFGRNSILITAWIGVPVHEAGHFIMCWLFNHRVIKVKLLDLRSNDGTLGYVQHSYNRGSIYQNIGNFFIGIGPILSGNIVLIGSMYILLPEVFNNFSGQLSSFTSNPLTGISILNSMGILVSGLAASLFDPVNLENINFWTYIFLALCISAHIALSKEDTRGATRGLPVIFLILVVANTLTLLIYNETPDAVVEIFRYNIYLLAFSILSILFSVTNLLISYLAWIVRKRISLF